MTDPTSSALAQAVNSIAAEAAAPGEVSPSTAPSFVDIPGFATAAELSAVASDPTKLSEFLTARWQDKGRVNEMLRKKAEMFQAIADDPVLSAAVNNAINGHQPNGAPPRKLQEADELAQLREKVNRLEAGLSKRDEAQTELQAFAAEHPDMARYVPTMQKLIAERPHLKLPDLYELAKARQGTPGAPSTPPPASERPTAGIAPDRTTDPALTRLSRELQDRGKFKSFDEALDHAVQFAQSKG